MPNHVSNRLQLVSIIGDWEREEKALEILQARMKTEESQFDFNVLFPYPEPYKSLDDARHKLEKEVGLGAALSVKDGYNQGGYEWCREHWGTKWNAYNIGFDYDAVYFQTAWSTPEPIFAELSKHFSHMRLEVEYADEDRGNNCGRLTYVNGKRVAYEDMANRPDSLLFARAVIAEQEAAHLHAELQESTKVNVDLHTKEG